MKFLTTLFLLVFLPFVAHAEDVAAPAYAHCFGDPQQVFSVPPKTEAQKLEQHNYLTALKEKANSGDVPTQYRLGSIYESGKSLPEGGSFEEAAKWYRMAADHGDVASQMSLGRLYEDGHGVKQDREEAARWFERAADQGSSAGQCELGQMYFRGDGVSQDYAQAYFWMSLAQIRAYTAEKYSAVTAAAAEHLNPQQKAELQKRIAAWTPTPAANVDQLQNGMGAYSQGDYQAALRIWQPLAEHGNAEAQGWLAWMHWEGQGVKHDAAEAAKWYLKAAERDDGYAQVQIGLIYAWGSGVKQDYAESYFWLSVAAKHGFSTEELLREPNGHLAPEEKLNLDKRVQEWCSTHCKPSVAPKTAMKPTLHRPGADVVY